MFYQKGRFNYSDKLHVVVLAVTAFMLNEYIYYDEKISLVINVALLLAGFLLFLRKSLSLFTFIPYIGFLLNTRPREIHIIPIESRGVFDYYSVNIQKAVFFSFSTTLIILISLLVILYVCIGKIRLRRITSYVVFAIFISVISTMVFGVRTNSLYLMEATNSLRYLIFVLGGALVFDFYKIDKCDNEVIINSIIKILLSAILLSILYIVKDVALSDYKLRYVTSSIFFSASIFYCALNTKMRVRYRLVIVIFSLIVFFPITRGEQINMFICFLIYVTLSFHREHNRSYKNFFMSKALVIGCVLSFLTGLIYIYAYLPETWNMVVMKFSFFMSTDLNHDQSSSVRSSEFESIFAMQSLYDFIEIAIGKGLFGYYSLDRTVLTYLNESDFSLLEIENNRFFSTHNFLSFHLLKFGVIGTAFILIYYISCVSFRNVFSCELNYFLVLSFVPIMYISYFSPVFSFYYSFLLMVNYNAE